MTDVAIRTHSLGKQYRIGTRDPYQTVRGALYRAGAAPLRWMKSLWPPAASDRDGRSNELIWALRDVSFELPSGSIVGIVGRNGAGKSTLLKILSRITEPTEGRAEIHGRVGSLIEVGTGFHPELTGRENVLLNAAILGMSRATVTRRFDEIVAFAEVEKFIDTPVKHYSSGMFMRLAFAVAAHLEPDILLVDEVLAVGDVAFQRKCLGKMGHVAKEGRTVLFVSHSTAAILSLCQLGLLLTDGRVEFQGSAAATVDKYLRSLHASESAWVRLDGRPPDRDAPLRVREVRLTDAAGLACSRFQAGSTIGIGFVCEAPRLPPNLLCVVMVRTASGIPVHHVAKPLSTTSLNPREFHISCRIIDCTLFPGDYVVSVWVGRNAHQPLDYVRDVLTFVVDQGELPGIDFDLNWQHGLCHCESRWTVEEVECAVP